MRGEKKSSRLALRQAITSSRPAGCAALMPSAPPRRRDESRRRLSFHKFVDEEPTEPNSEKMFQARRSDDSALMKTDETITRSRNDKGCIGGRQTSRCVRPTYVKTHTHTLFPASHSDKIPANSRSSVADFGRRFFLQVRVHVSVHRE